MTHVYQNYYCETDERQIVLYEKKEVSDTRRAKSENIGKDRYIAVGYYTNISDVLKSIVRQIEYKTLAKDYDELIDAVSNMRKEVEKMMMKVKLDKKL